MYDPTREYSAHKESFDAAVSKVIAHGLFINGPEVAELETKLKEFTGAKYAITCANGTDALFVSMLGLGIGSGDEVITVAHTWISTAETIALTGAKPVFVDITKGDFNMDPAKIEAKITDKTKAILFVSLYGLMPDCQAIRLVADKYRLPVIEDAAQSFGAKYQGHRSCSCQFTDIATTSFFPSKPLGCWGDGGAIFTNNHDLAAKVRAIKNHGCQVRFKHDYVGVNSRLDTIQAAVLLTKLDHFEDALKRRDECAKYYNEKLSIVTSLVKPTYDPSVYSHVWAQYSLLCPNRQVRDSLVDYLKENKVNIAIFYPIGLHKQKCFENLETGPLDVTEFVCDTVINLPCYADITRAEQDYIISNIYTFFAINA